MSLNDRKRAEFSIVELVRRTRCLDIASSEPDKVSLFKFGGRRCVSVKVSGLVSLRFFKFGLELSANSSEPVSEITRCRVCCILRDAWLEAGVKAVVCEERRMTCRCIFEVVVSKFSERQVIDPVILLVRAVRAEVSLECLVGTLGKAVCARMIGRRSVERELQLACKFIPEFGDEEGTAVGDDGFRNSVVTENSVDE